LLRYPLLRYPFVRLFVSIFLKLPLASLMIPFLELIYGCKMPSATYHVDSLLPLFRSLLDVLGLGHCLVVHALAVNLLDRHNVSVALIRADW
jgi:hypothetical protein